MRLASIIFLTVLALAGFGASVALGRHGHTFACSVNNGGVDGYHATAKHTCGAVTVHALLYSSDTVRALTPSGTLDFHTSYLAQCHEDTGAVDVIAPATTVAINHVSGTTWCRHQLAQKTPTWLTTPNAKIRISGTIFGLTATPKGSLVQVVEGTATVTPNVQKTPRTVAQNTQLLVPSAGLTGKPTPLVVPAADQQTVLALQQDVIQMGEPQVAEHLQSRGETSVVIVGDSLASTKAQAALLPGVRAAQLTAAQVTANPKVLIAAMEQTGAHSVVTVGSFAAVGSIWSLVRAQTTLPPTTAVVYATP